MHRNRIPWLFTLLVGITLLAARTSAHATEWQSPASILETANSFLHDYASGVHAERTEVQLGNLDPRLKMKACTLPLEGFMAPGARETGNTTVGVRCPDEGGWSLYVTARINVFGLVLVSTEPMARGAPVTESALELVERNLSALPYGYYTDPSLVTGKLAKRTIAANSVLTPQMLEAPKWVKRGERVTLVAESGPMKVRMVGEALSDGREGDLVRVRADGSQRVVDGIVISQGVIKVTL